jgi:hypothetical protein
VPTEFDHLVATHLVPRRRVALVLPTTDASLAAADAARQRHGATVVGSLAATSRPVDVLGMCATSEAPGSIVVFSDQILSSADTPVLVRSGDDASFHSVFEFLLVARHGYDLFAWAGDSHALRPEGSTLDDVLRTLHRHFGACGELQGTWRMRDRQAERALDWRRRTAERAIRSFESAVCMEYCTEPQHPDASRLLGSARALARSMRQAHAT